VELDFVLTTLWSNKNVTQACQSSLSKKYGMSLCDIFEWQYTCHFCWRNFCSIDECLLL